MKVMLVDGSGKQRVYDTPTHLTVLSVPVYSSVSLKVPFESVARPENQHVDFKYSGHRHVDGRGRVLPIWTPDGNTYGIPFHRIDGNVYRAGRLTGFTCWVTREMERDSVVPIEEVAWHAVQGVLKANGIHNPERVSVTRVQPTPEDDGNSLHQWVVLAQEWIDVF